MVFQGTLSFICLEETEMKDERKMKGTLRVPSKTTSFPLIKRLFSNRDFKDGSNHPGQKCSDEKGHKNAGQKIK